MKKIFNEILMTISFLSRIPAGGTGEIKKIPRYFTIVGYLSGLLYMILTAIMGKGVFQVVLTMVVAFFFFDLFHFDGLLDTLDGFLNQNKEKRLEIMSKGDTGPFAMFYGIVFIGTFFYCLTQADSLMLLYSGVFSRFTMNVV
ncbi:MAG TPA: adenosylcobinamide-GDP ribazoletransferase, partial [Petrotogaceae bacterium]|nr:adenosylcobinamide-GDP ribazoletransferase [Petrotogaceae bacterium]